MMTNTNETRTVAVFVLAQDADFAVPQSYAGYNETIRVAAGRYPVVCKRNDYGRPYLRVTLPGLCVSAYYGSLGEDGRVGKPGVTWLQPYRYEVAQGEPACVRFARDLEPNKFESSNSPGALEHVTIATWEMVPGETIPSDCR